MSEAAAQSSVYEHPPEVDEYLEPDLTRERFIARGKAFLADLYEWLRDNNNRMRGRQALSRFTRAHDLLIEAAHAQVAQHWKPERGAAGTPQVAVVALGGYGRGDLFLRSDVDLMLLLDSRKKAQDLAFVKTLLHLLIDLKLNLGYTTRTLDDCEAVFGIDLDSTTAMIESRWVSGNKALCQRMDEVIGHLLQNRWRKWFLKSTYEQWRERHELFESTVFLLEPNVKESAGGLRDVHGVYWTLFALTGSTDLKQLKEEAGFEDGELRAYRDAINMIQIVRNEIHIAAASQTDQLSFNLQPTIAKRLGYEADTHRTPEEVFMGDYYRHARTVARSSNRAIRVLLRREQSTLSELFGSLRRKKLDSSLVVQDHTLFVDPARPQYFEENPRRVMALFERAAKLGLRVSEETKDQLARQSAQLGPAFRLDPANSEAFLHILKGPRHVAETMGDMHDCGVLDKFMPEFERISCMVRIDYYHHYTVDAHTIKALEMAERLQRDVPGEPSFPHQLASQVRRWDLLNLALLLHDVGKGFGRGHALRGGQIAQRVGDRLHLAPADIETVRFLVLSHLKLSHAAQRRDLSDPRVAQQLAEEIGTLDRLKLLYLHSVCDLMAVSPEAWNEWKDQLLAECYMRTAEVLGESHAAARRPAPNLTLLHGKVVEAIREELRAAPPAPAERKKMEAELEDFLKHVSDRYIQTSTPVTIACHFLMRRALDDKNAIDWRLQHDTGAGFSELAVAAADVPGLFSDICGALAAKDLNIWSAQIFSTTDGYALNQFQVTDLENNPLPAGLRLERLRQDLNQVVLGEKPIEALIEKHKGRPRRRARGRSPIPSTVLIDNNSREATIIEIRTPDRPGLLYQITRALSECQLNIQRAIITTEAYGVVDVFYVTDLEYNKIYDPIQKGKIQETILAAIGGK